MTSKEYIIVGVKAADPENTNVYKCGEEQLQGMFTVLFRKYFGDSKPKSYPSPEDIVKTVETKGKFKIVVDNKKDDKLIFVIKRADKADFPHSYANIEF